MQHRLELAGLPILPRVSQRAKSTVPMQQQDALRTLRRLRSGFVGNLLDI